MHPDDLRLASYIDGGLDAAERAAVRAHVLTCRTCAARLEQLQADARRIVTVLTDAVPAPDVRAALRARRRRGMAGAWLVRGGALAAGLVALVLFAVLIGIRSGATLGRVPDRLFVVDQQNRQLVELDTYDGRRLGAVEIGLYPSSVLYDGRRDRLYVLFSRGVISVDPRTLEVVNRWEAPRSFDVNAQIVLDEPRGRLYISQPNEGMIAQIDIATFTLTRSLPAGANPGALALAPDGDTLYTIDGDKAILALDLANGGAARTLAQRAAGERGMLALSRDGQTLYLLRLGGQILLQRIDTRSGQASAPAPLDGGPQPWSMLLLDAGQLAIARGDGLRGGVEIVATGSLNVTSRLDPSYDQHTLVAGPGGSLFALNWLHGTVTRYDADTAAVVWRTPQEQWQPKSGAFIPGGWRWPW